VTRFINVRGCNGSGKTTLLRQLGKEATHVTQVTVPDHRPIPITIGPGWAIVGDYTEAAAGCTTAGLDRIKTQAAAKAAAEEAAKLPGVNTVLFEGVVVSTIYGPWKEWSDRNGGMIWAFLDTPLEVCLQRIQARNGGKPIKEDQVADKHRTISRVRDKALADHQAVLSLPYLAALEALKSYV
jgi:predicted ABC-type ATPase